MTKEQERIVTWLHNFSDVRRDAATLIEQQAKEIELARVEVVAVIERIPGAVRVCESGGPENIYTSLAVSVASLKSQNEELKEALEKLDYYAAELLSHETKGAWAHYDLASAEAKALSRKVEMLPVGTRIRFVKVLCSPADEDSPGNVYACVGQTGTITGHGTPEGYWVKTDSWPNAFGASSLEFEVLKQAKAEVCSTCGGVGYLGHKSQNDYRKCPTCAKAEVGG